MPQLACTASPKDGSDALTRALSDPQVESLARSLHLDLQDPVALSGLLAVTQQYVDTSPEIDASRKQMFAQTLTPGQSRYARDALRTYREVAAMH